jgi:hypothetical protein
MLTQNPTPFPDPTLERLGIQRNFLNMIKGIYEKPQMT